jgi:hypothetical protein
MVNAQFQMLSEGAVDAAYAFVSPVIVEQYNMDAKKFRRILSKGTFEGLIGCSDWTITETSTPDDDVAVVKLRVVMKPFTGCVRILGVAEQGGITWPMNYKWVLRKQAETAEANPGCWLLEQMFLDRPPIDVEGQDGTLLLNA